MLAYRPAPDRHFFECPLDFAGRSDTISAIHQAILTAKQGRPAKPFLITGLHGTGKTALLQEILFLAEDYVVTDATASSQEPLADTFRRALSPVLRKLVDDADEPPSPQSAVFTCFDALDDLSATDCRTSAAALERKLATLFELVATAARDAHSVWILLMDDLQAMTRRDFDALLGAVITTAQKPRPFVFAGFGMPPLVRRVFQTNLHAGRLFHHQTLGPLASDEVQSAILPALTRFGLRLSADAADEILKISQGWPFALLNWPSALCDAAQGPVVMRETVLAVQSERPQPFAPWKKRLTDGLTPTSIALLEAMLWLGGPCSFADLARHLCRSTAAVAQTAQTLESEGFVYEPEKGVLDFAAPMMADWLKTVLPR